MGKIDEWREAGFSEDEIRQYVIRKQFEWKEAGFSDKEISDHLGIANPVPNEMENHSLLARARNYLGISEKPQRPISTQSVMDETLRQQIEMNFPTQAEESIANEELDIETRRVLAQGISGLTGGLSELFFGKVERPKTTAGAITGAGLELGGFIFGPLKASKLILGSRLAPTASGLKGMAQILAQGGATLGLASGLSRVIPGFLEDQDLGEYALDIGKSTAIGALTGAIYPLFGAIPTKPLRVATALVVMDKLRAGTDQMFTIDDFVQGLGDGTIDKKEMGQMAFNYLMDIYFTLKTPAMRLQLKALEKRPGGDIVKEILKLDADEVGQTVLDISNREKIETKLKESGLPAEKESIGSVRDAEGTIESKMRPSMSDEDFINHANSVVDKLIAEKRAMPNERDALLKKMLQNPEELSKASPETAMEMTLKYGPEKELTELATESMLEKGVKRDPKLLFSEQIANEWLAEPSKYKEIASKYDMSVEEFATTLKEQASAWGRKLGLLGVEAQKLGRADPEYKKLYDEMKALGRGVSAWDTFYSWFKRADNVRRGLLVTQLSTSMRNFETQLGRVGIDVFEKGLDAGIQKLIGKGTTDPMTGVEELIQVFHRSESKEIATKVLGEFRGEYDRLYGGYMSDIETGRVGQAVTRGVDILNIANRFQEYLFRNGIFTATLEQSLKAQGRDLAKIIESNEVGSIPQKLIHEAVERSLEMTFAQTPTFRPAKLFVDFINAVPTMTFALPFPRFLMNAIKFQYQYSPFGALKFLNEQERVAFKNGDVQVLSKAIIGTVMLGAAYLFRDSEYAGERWYELRAGDKTFDMRPFNPFSAYLFIADIAKKIKDGTLDTFTTSDIIQGVLSSNLRAGTGLFAVDKILTGFLGKGDSEKAWNTVKQFVGELMGGFFIPLSQVRDFVSSTFEEAPTVKEKRSTPFLGPIIEKIPGIERLLPEKYTPTRERPIERKGGTLKQMTGLIFREKNIFEKELDRLGFSWQEIFHSTGNPEADNLLQKHMGTLASQVIEPFVKSERYQKLSDERKSYLLSQLLTGLRSAAKEGASEEDPALFAEIMLDKIPKRERRVYEEEGVDFDKLKSNLRKKRGK